MIFARINNDGKKKIEKGNRTGLSNAILETHFNSLLILKPQKQNRMQKEWKAPAVGRADVRACGINALACCLE
tara:strand:+ start:1501 stop:1719 length:219 start_codon:yes stop_codon:yes gene_type:complete